MPAFAGMGGQARKENAQAPVLYKKGRSLSILPTILQW
jgi:hypothetical protein